MNRPIAHRTLAEAIDALNRGLAACTRPEDRAVVGQYLAALAPILAAATLGEDVLPQLPRIDRLLGHTCLIDERPFEEGLAKWRQFKDEHERGSLGAMTVNERLHAMGLLEAYDRASAMEDWDAVAELLRKVHVDEASIAKIARPRSAG